jgi:type IV pilus assembly protein PilO
MALLPSDPARQKQLLVAVLPLILALVYWNFVYTPAAEELAGDRTRLEQLEGRNAQARAIATSGGPELERRLALYEQHIARLEQLIPTREEVPELLHAMTLEARQAGVELARMRPEAEVPGAFYNQQSYEMAVIGQYHDVARFLTAVGSLPRIVTATDVRLTTRSEARGARREAESDQREDPRHRGATLDANFRIQTYVLPLPALQEAGDARS